MSGASRLNTFGHSHHGMRDELGEGAAAGTGNQLHSPLLACPPVFNLTGDSCADDRQKSEVKRALLSCRFAH
jgi:hypothetical protein